MVHTQTQYECAIEELERHWIEYYMKQFKYNQSRTAKEMGISRGTLRTKLYKYFGNEYFRNT